MINLNLPHEDIWNEYILCFFPTHPKNYEILKFVCRIENVDQYGAGVKSQSDAIYLIFFCPECVFG